MGSPDTKNSNDGMSTPVKHSQSDGKAIKLHDQIDFNSDQKEESDDDKFNPQRQRRSRQKEMDMDAVKDTLLDSKFHPYLTTLT